MREKPDGNHGDVGEGNEWPEAALYNPQMQWEEQEKENKDPRGGFNDISLIGVFSPSPPLTHTHLYSVRAKIFVIESIADVDKAIFMGYSLSHQVSVHAHATLGHIASPAAQLVAVVHPAAPSKCKLMNTSHSLPQECAYPPVCCEEGPAS